MLVNAFSLSFIPDLRFSRVIKQEKLSGKEKRHCVSIIKLFSFVTDAMANSARVFFCSKYFQHHLIFGSKALCCIVTAPKTKDQNENTCSK